MTHTPPGPHDPQPTGAALRRGPFQVGERIQLTDPKGRLHTITIDTGGVRHGVAVGSSDEVVMGEEAPVGVELLAGLQDDGVQAALRVGELDPLPHLE